MKKNTIWMLALWGIIFLFLLLDYVYATIISDEAYVVIKLFITTGFVFAWFLADAKENEISPSRALKIGVIALGVFAVPYYLFKFKGWKRTLVSLLKFLTFFTVVVFYAATLEILFYSNV